MGDGFDRAGQPFGMPEQTADGRARGVNKTVAVVHVAIAAEGNGRAQRVALGSGPRRYLVLTQNAPHLFNGLCPEKPVHRVSLGARYGEAVHAAQTTGIAAIAGRQFHALRQRIAAREKARPRVGGRKGGVQKRQQRRHREKVKYGMKRADGHQPFVVSDRAR